MCIEIADLGNITNRMPCGSVEFFMEYKDIPYHETSIKEEHKSVFLNLLYLPLVTILERGLIMVILFFVSLLFQGCNCILSRNNN